ncbi:hypothetical protein YC2023_039725 [Brassica napus]
MMLDSLASLLGVYDFQVIPLNGLYAKTAQIDQSLKMPLSATCMATGFAYKRERSKVSSQHRTTYRSYLHAIIDSLNGLGLIVQCCLFPKYKIARILNQGYNNTKGKTTD